MAELVADLRYSARTLARSRGFTLVATLTLALGIGANTAIYSVVSGILLTPLAVPDGERLVVVCETSEEMAGFCSTAPSTAVTWDRSAGTLQAAGVGRIETYGVLLDGETVSGRGGRVTGGFFDVFRMRPELGRVIREPDVGAGRGRVVVLTDSFWQQRLGADPEVLGTSLVIDGTPHAVVGVMPADFEPPLFDWADFFVPLDFDVFEAERVGWRGFQGVALRRPGAGLDEVGSELRALQAAMGQEYPESHVGWGVAVHDMRDWIVGDVRPMLLVFLGAVGLVLLIACANVANLLIARATVRRTEWGVRAALGAGPRHLLQLVLAEGALLSFLGGVLGVGMAVFGTDLFLGLAPPGIPRLDEVGIDAGVLGFALGLALLTTLLFALLPALRLRRLRLTAVLAEGQARGGDGSGSRTRSALVVAEIALASMLLIGSVLLGRSFLTMLQWDPGFERDGLYSAWVLGSRDGDGRTMDVPALFQAAVDEVAALPGVEHVSRASNAPLVGGRETDTARIVGRPEEEGVVVNWYDIGHEYFDTLGLPILRGRDFDERDVQGAPPVAILNETAAARLFPEADPLGRRLSLEWTGEVEVVGVVRDMQPFPPGTPPPAEIFWPQAQFPRLATYLFVRAEGAEPGFLRVAEERLQQLDPSLQVTAWQSMNQRLDRQLVRPRFSMVLLGVFAAVALLLASVGVYGLMAYTVARRRHEIGVRLALGAGPGHIHRTVVRDGMVLATVGLLFGAAGAAFLNRWLASQLHGVGTGDPLAYGVATLLLAAIALAACHLPGRRASRLDPVSALRVE